VSNLGFYRDVTKFIKWVGGPAAAKAVLTGGAAALLVAGGAAHVGYEKAAPKIKSWITKRGKPDVPTGSRYTVHTVVVDDQGLEFSVDDTFTVVARDGETVVIALTGKADNPWAVSAKLLASVSDFPDDDDAVED
jgi:hypothetical protein